MTTIIETDACVFELHLSPGPLPGTQRATLTLLSGAPLTDEEWQRVQQCCVQDLIDSGKRVLRVRHGRFDE